MPYCGNLQPAVSRGQEGRTFIPAQRGDIPDGERSPRPVISGILGHSSPDALGTYLHADFAGLKACSLDVSMFPVGKEVFGDA